MKKRKARKEHTCTLCHKKIEAGDEYMYQRVTPWDHVENEHFFNYKSHIDCNKIWQKNGDEVDWLLPDNWDEFIEYFDHA